MISAADTVVDTSKVVESAILYVPPGTEVGTTDEKLKAKGLGIVPAGLTGAELRGAGSEPGKMYSSFAGTFANVEISLSGS